MTSSSIGILLTWMFLFYFVFFFFLLCVECSELFSTMVSTVFSDITESEQFLGSGGRGVPLVLGDGEPLLSSFFSTSPLELYFCAFAFFLSDEKFLGCLLLI
jgi:hypothetical protein